MARTDDILSFMREAEKLNTVYRRIMVSDLTRRESDSEHSYHLALMLLLFEKELPEGFDMLKALKLALIHDMVEIEAGDTFFYDEERRKGKKERELAAAKTLFAKLPSDLERDFMALFSEYEDAETVEAKVVQGFDKVHPIFMNLVTDGHTWKEHGITFSQLDSNKRPRMLEPLSLDIYERLIAEAKGRGLLR